MRSLINKYFYPIVKNFEKLFCLSCVRDCFAKAMEPEGDKCGLFFQMIWTGYFLWNANMTM